MDYKELIACLQNAAGGPEGVAMCHDAATAITDLLSRAEAAEARCALLDEARENANEACAKWEGLYRMALEREEKAERERDAAVDQLRGLCSACKHYTPYHNDGPCATCTHEVACFVPEEATEKWEWVGIKIEDAQAALKREISV